MRKLLDKKLVIVFCLGWLFVIFEFAVRVSDSVLLPQLQHSLNLSAAQLATLSAVYYFAYVLWMIPGGILVDRFGLYRSWFYALLLVIVGCALFALRIDYDTMIASRILLGIGSSYAVNGMVVLSAGRKHAGLLIGITIALACVGVTIGQGPWLAISDWFGHWEINYWMSAVIAFALMVSWFLCGDNLLNKTGIVEPVSFSAIKNTLRILVRSPSFWILAIFMTCLSGQELAFLSLWGPHYIHVMYHINVLDSAYINSAMAIGSVLGAILAGLVFDWMKNLRMPLLLMGISTIFLMIVLIQAWFPSRFVLITILFLIGLTTSANIVIFALFGKRFIHFSRFTVQGAANMMNIIGGPLFQLAVGFLIDRQTPVLKDQLTAPVMHNALWFLPIVLIVATLALCFVPKRSLSTISL